ncbi:MAG TPA: CHAT domain-containing tetratricopeptide repeat protein [Puia sp.]|nr:CHAT domain-containing tetratricopeptide repeat protein [Puia sp.]
MPCRIPFVRTIGLRAVLAVPALLVFIVLTSGGPGGDDQRQGERITHERLQAMYRRADSLYHLTHSTPVTDSLALAGFGAVIEGVQAMPGHPETDTLLAGAFLKKGILLDAAGDFAGAKACYAGALNSNPQQDSLSFVAEVYMGAIYYNLTHFDSAHYFLLKAQALAGRFKDQDDEVRLYNSLGVLYFDNGNYGEARDYFDKALGFVKGKKPLDVPFMVSLELNIATASSRLGQYREALNTYRELLGYHIYSNDVYMNMGNAYGELNENAAALAYYHRVDAKKVPAVLNEIASLQEQLHRLDSCRWYLQQLQQAAKEDPGSVPVMDLGVNALIESELLRDQGQYMAALSSLQKVIGIFSHNFHDPDVYANPTEFAGTFADYRLFDALVEKAEDFRTLYGSQPDKRYLRACYSAYTAALSLLRYIEKSYATDESKLFLKKESGPMHAAALQVCLQLDRLYPDSGYKEQAFLISERSKASVITANLEEKEFTAGGAGEQLLQQVNDYKYNIARLNVKSETTTDSGELAAITREKEGDELELSRLERTLEQNGEYYQLKYGDAAVRVGDLQKQLQSGQALISLYAADSVLHVWVVTPDRFTYLRIDSLAALQRDVEDWLAALKTTGNGHRFHGETIGNRLYARLIQPIQRVTDAPEWIIVPDGFLYLLPWESLPADANGERRLVETTTISYRWSSKLLRSGEGTGNRTAAQAVRREGILSFAPFAASGAAGADGPFSRLPASAEEIAGLAGTQFLDAQATKTQFLHTAAQYPIVHLATHAVSSPDNAAASFIAFYPAKHSPIEDRLYLEELYGLNLGATRLVIISACETGEGEVVAQEGVMSLARAFAYAGCASTINSLWKADDQATSFILRRFYVHLRAGEDKARALQLAKLDYLKSDALDKSPAYWAHLVLTGDSSALYSRGFWAKWWWLAVAIGAGAGVLVVWRQLRKKKSRRFKTL